MIIEIMQNESDTHQESDEVTLCQVYFLRQHILSGRVDLKI